MKEWLLALILLGSQDWRAPLYRTRESAQNIVYFKSLLLVVCGPDQEFTRSQQGFQDIPLDSKSSCCPFLVRLLSGYTPNRGTDTSASVPCATVQYSYDFKHYQ